MSGFISAASGLYGAMQNPEDRRGIDLQWSDTDLVQPTPTYPQGLPSVLPDPGFASPWWPSGGNLLGGFDGVPENTLLTVAGSWIDPWPLTGSNGRLGFVGTTRDAYGSPLGGCTVRLFLTSTNELVAQVTSDANGAFIASTPYGGQGHYMTVHNSSVTPAVAGASIDSLIPG